MLCMNLRYIGAMMLVVRALVAGLDLIVRPASGHPLSDVKQPLRFAAMVPLQVYNTLRTPEEKERLKQTEILIIGGGAIDEALETEIKSLPGAVYSTYGMTETLSHIALRRLNGTAASERYYPFSSVNLSLSPENTLVIDAPLVCDGVLQTNDIARIYPDKGFIILGRKDNVINSGGIKIQAEEVEKLLRPFISVPFVITSVPDQRLGQAVTLLIEGRADTEEIENMRDYVAAQCSPKQGAAGLSACCDKIFRALSEYCLQTDAALTGMITLTAREDGLDFALNDAGPQKLFDLLPAAYTGAVEEIRKELNDLVGLAPVKEYVFGLADNIQVQQRRAAAGLKTASLSMHMIFTGNPGTGKTTIARLVAKYLKAIGALKGGQLVEVSRGDLVGRYTGHTAPLTNSVIQGALGGVLFIDEAYSLYRGEQDSFGLEAIDTLVKGMEDHRDELVVILAGYTKEMETFLTANSGLASRFPNKIEFPDYTADELLDITNVLARGKGYRLAESCTEPLRGYYERRQAEDARTAGNGRLARNTLEKAIFNQSRRLVAEPAAELDVILPSDLEL